MRWDWEGEEIDESGVFDLVVLSTIHFERK
jgi:hypothetical protein